MYKLDPNAYFRSATEKELREEQGFFDQPEIEEITSLDNIELQPVQELLNYKNGFLDLDIEVPWPVPFPNDKEHHAIWQNEIQIAKDMFKVDGAEYAFSTWFTKAEEFNLVNEILEAKNDNELMQAVFLKCLYHNYLEEEINENLEIAVDAYRASDKGSKKWLRDMKDQIKSRKYEAGMTEKRAQEILNAIDNAFKIIDKYESIRESKKAGGKYVRGGPNVILTKKTKPGCLHSRQF
ncbi:hypothetical protein Glove_197g70 [Diversispora epigaea]|uniref:Uncharacterized protein n=1 Tax=Diversispora epigaea TaxID=1348612 RepID=A0A397IV05_9GLOM|nr:hypothetical protein Glove_197g70 [Diversispora epigaea]